VEQPEPSVVWHRSRYCGEAGSCVEVAKVGDAVAMRDSKNPDGPILLFDQVQWTAFLATVCTEEYPNPKK
jgi:hypothetical protein